VTTTDNITYADGVRPPKRRNRPAETPWLTTREAMEYTGFGLRSLRYHVARGNVIAYVPRGSRALRFHRRDLDDFLSAGSSKAGK
jgi:excisionase family DNA binding protein